MSVSARPSAALAPSASDGLYDWRCAGTFRGRGVGPCAALLARVSPTPHFILTIRCRACGRINRLSRKSLDGRLVHWPQTLMRSLLVTLLRAFPGEVSSVTVRAAPHVATDTLSTVELRLVVGLVDGQAIRAFAAFDLGALEESDLDVEALAVESLVSDASRSIALYLSASAPGVATGH